MGVLHLVVKDRSRLLGTPDGVGVQPHHEVPKDIDEGVADGVFEQTFKMPHPVAGLGHLVIEKNEERSPRVRAHLKTQVARGIGQR